MSVTRSSLIGGAAHLNIGTYSTHLENDGSFDTESTWNDVMSALYGKVDASASDFSPKISGTPLTYDASTTPPALFPWLTAIRGNIYPATDVAHSLQSNNGDLYSLTAGVITKMSDITFSADKNPFGPMEITGLPGDGMNPQTDASYYTITPAGSYTPLGLDKTKVPRGAYTWAWGSVTGMTAFEFQEPPVLSWDLKLEIIKVQGRAKAVRFLGLLAMLKGKPTGPTASQLLSAAKFVQNASATHGHLASINAVDLVGSGPIAMTMKNAALMSAGFKFGNATLRNGEVGFLTTLNASAGAPAQIVTFA